MAEEGPTPGADVYGETFARARNGIYKAVEWLVRFAELVLLAAVFQYAAHKTRDYQLTILAALLGLGACFYVAEYFQFAWGPLVKHGGRSWWRWALTITIAVLIVWFTVRTASQITQAINALETTQR